MHRKVLSPLTRQASESKPQEVGGKTPTTRLLDLLAGWCDFVSADEENNVPDSGLSAEEIGDLYQLAGGFIEEWEGLSPDGQEKAVRAFVEERILPLLLRTGKAA